MNLYCCKAMAGQEQTPRLEFPAKSLCRVTEPVLALWFSTVFSSTVLSCVFFSSWAKKGGSQERPQEQYQQHPALDRSEMPSMKFPGLKSVLRVSLSVSWTPRHRVYPGEKASLGFYLLQGFHSHLPFTLLDLCRWSGPFLSVLAWPQPILYSLKIFSPLYKLMMESPSRMQAL